MPYLILGKNFNGDMSYWSKDKRNLIYTLSSMCYYYELVRYDAKKTLQLSEV